MKNIFIVGPTGSGKTDISLKIAQEFHGEIVSCDSMQIYKDMDIGTAKVTENEKSIIPHHMIDIVEANEYYSVAEYSKRAKNIISKINNESKIAIICGGTGLYLDSLLFPLSFFNSEKNNKIREELIKESEMYGKEFVYNKLLSVDEKSAKKLHVNDVKRVVRALEIYYSTGKRKSDIAENDNNIIDESKYIVINLTLPRELLYEKIDKRVDKMFDDGLVDEVKGLIEKGVGFDCQSMQAIGYKEFKDYLYGSASLSELKEKIKKNTRNYAKRQITWFKKYSNIINFDSREDVSNLISIIKNRLN